MQMYILHGHDPVPTWDALQWAKQFERIENRKVREDTLGHILVSTVFLGMDHGPPGKPLLFETMVFGGPLDGEMTRYGTWEEAEKGHEAILTRVQSATAQVHRLPRRWIPESKPEKDPEPAA